MGKCISKVDERDYYIPSNSIELEDFEPVFGECAIFWDIENIDLPLNLTLEEEIKHYQTLTNRIKIWLEDHKFITVSFQAVLHLGHKRFMERKKSRTIELTKNILENLGVQVIVVQSYEKEAADGEIIKNIKAFVREKMNDERARKIGVCIISGDDDFYDPLQTERFMNNISLFHIYSVYKCSDHLMLLEAKRENIEKFSDIQIYGYVQIFLSEYRNSVETVKLNCKRFLSGKDRVYWVDLKYSHSTVLLYNDMEMADIATKQILENLQINPWIRRVNFLGKEDFMKLESQWRNDYLARLFNISRDMRQRSEYTGRRQMDYTPNLRTNGNNQNESLLVECVSCMHTCTIL